MNLTNKTVEKRIYNTPMVVRIKLDNEISLQLESDAPAGPEESFFKAPEYFKTDPFKPTLG